MLQRRKRWLDPAGAACLQHTFPLRLFPLAPVPAYIRSFLGRSRSGCSYLGRSPCEYPTRTHDRLEGNMRTGAQQLRPPRLTTPRRVHVQVDLVGSSVGEVSVATFGVARGGLARYIGIGLASSGRRAPTGALVDNAKVVGGAFVAEECAPRKGPSCTDGPGRFGHCMKCKAVGKEHLQTWAIVSLGMSAIASSVEMLARSCRPYWSATGSAMPSELHTPVSESLVRVSERGWDASAAGLARTDGMLVSAVRA